MDDEFVSRIASLERSMQSVGQGRERYLSSTVASALGRGVGSSGGGVHPPSSPKFRISFPGSTNSGGDRTVDFVDYSAYDRAAHQGGGSSTHYDPNAVPPQPSLRKTGGTAQNTGYDLYAIDPNSEAYAVCPRCAHLERLEESVAVVEEQYRAELEHLRKMVGQVDGDRLDVVQRLSNTQEGLESLRSQLLDKDRILNDWRQRAIVAEEALATEQRLHTSSMWDLKRNAQFAAEQLMSLVLNAETNCRTEIVAGEHVTRAAWWSMLDNSMLHMHRTSHIAKLKLEQERYARKALEMKEADADLRRQMEVLEANHKRRESGAAKGAMVSNGSGRRLLDDAPVQQQQHRRRSSSHLSDGVSAAAAQLALGDDEGSAAVAPAVLHRCLSDPNLPNDLHELEPQQDAGRRQAEGPSFSNERSPGATGQPALSRLVDDVSFGDLEIEDDDALVLVPTGSSGGNEAAQTDLQRWQRLLAESDTARRQLEGHLMTEQHYSNELQLEVEDLMLREGEGDEAFRRAKMELLEVTFRHELVLQSHRRLEHLLVQSPQSAKSVVPGVPAAATNNTDGEDVAMMQKELRVLRQLYTSAKEDAIAARKELQDQQLLAENALVGSVAEDSDVVAAAAALKQVGSAPMENDPSTSAGTVALPTVSPPATLTAAAIAQAVLQQLSPTLVAMQASLGQVLQQLTVVSDQDDGAVQKAVPSEAAVDGEPIANGTTAADAEAKGHKRGSVGDTPPPPQEGLIASASSGLVVPQPRGSFAALLLQRVQSATQMHHESVRTMLEQSIHETDAKMNDLAEQLRSSLRPTPNTTMLDTSIQPTHQRTARAGSGGSLTPGPLDGVSSSRTSTPVNLPHALSGDGSNQPGVAATAAQQQPRDALSLTKLQEALASMRNIMRNVLFSTSHNQKLLGEKLDELSIGQKSMMSELVASSASFASRQEMYTHHHTAAGGAHPMHSPTFSIGRQGSMGMGMMSTDAVLGASGSNNGSVMASPLHGTGAAGVQYSVPPALQQRVLNQQGATATARVPPAVRASVPALSHEEAAYVVEQFIDSEREHSGPRSGSGSAARSDITSPPAPPLPSFTKVQAAHPAAAATTAASGHSGSGGGLPSLQRRPSHKWDDEEEDSPLAVRRSVESTTTAKRSWHNVKSPYEEDSDNDS